MIIERQCKKEFDARLKTSLKRIKAVKSKDEILTNWYLKTLLNKKQVENIDNLSLKELKKIMADVEIKKQEKELKKELTKIEKIKSIEPIRHADMRIEWVNNRTWGNKAPRGEYRNGFYFENYKSITGCGYDRLSTLTANMLNDDAHMKKYLFDYCEKHHVNKENIRQKLSYGISMFDGMPYFEGGVGVECHVRILKKLGFKVQYISLKNADYIEFEKK